MNPEQRIKELLRPVGFRSKRINTEFPMFKDGVMEFDKWSTRITYKGKQLDNVYMAKKGDFKQPRLDMVLNSYFTNSYMYRNYDYFDIADLIGNGFNGASGVSEFMEHLKEVHEGLEKLFGDDFETYDEAFLSIRPAHRMLNMDRKLKQMARRNGPIVNKSR